jgi:hypothetical protein
MGGDQRAQIGVNRPVSIECEIESVKYDIDAAAFVVDRFIKSVWRRFDFNIDHGSL